MNRFGKWCVRRGSPGGTARWAATAFRYLAVRNPDSSPESLMETMIRSRYSVVPNNKRLAQILGALPRMTGVRDLVFEVLSVEASLLGNTPDVVMEIMDVVVQELYRKGLTDKDIWGEESAVQIGESIAKDFRDVRRLHPNAPLPEIYGALVVARYRQRALMRLEMEQLLARAPHVDCLMELVVGILRVEGKVTEGTVDAVGDEVLSAMLSCGLTAEEVLGGAANEMLGDRSGGS